MNRFQQQRFYETEGAQAATQGLLREDCPYDKEKDSEAWNFWVYGNENQQGAMIQKFMAREGSEPFFMTTGGSPEEMEALSVWAKKAKDANERMRKENGWKVLP